MEHYPVLLAKLLQFDQWVKKKFAAEPRTASAGSRRPSVMTDLKSKRQGRQIWYQETGNALVPLDCGEDVEHLSAEVSDSEESGPCESASAPPVNFTAIAAG